MHPDQIGPYRIEKKIGAGGMGNVYYGVHTESGQAAAVKVLPASLAREEGFVQRFSREIEALRRLKSRHIVELYEDGSTAEGSWYYAMEFVDGETLTTLIARRKRLPWNEVTDISLQVAAALKAAHDAGVVHRDIKPSNLMIAPDGTVKLTDFGVAHMFATTRLTRTGGVVGTAEYMSPEQARGQRATKRSDLYSLGAVMYAMLTGRPAFGGNNANEILHKQQFAQVEKPSHYAPDVPRLFEELVCQLLEKQPDRRIPDALVLSRKLQQVRARIEYGERQQTEPDEKPELQGEPTADSPLLPRQQRPVHGPGPATFVRNLMRQEAAAQLEKSPVARFFDNTFVLLAMLILVIGLGFYLSRNATPTSEEQLAEAKRLFDAGSGPGWIRARDLLRQLQDVRSLADEQAEIELMIHHINHYDFCRSLTLTSPADGSRDAEIHRLIRRAFERFAAGEVVQARADLKSVLSLVDNSRHDQYLAEFTQHTLEEWDDDSGINARQHIIRGVYTEAAGIDPQSDDAPTAVRLLNSVLVLYGDDAAVQEQILQCRTLLTRFDELAAGAPGHDAETTSNDDTAESSEQTPNPEATSAVPSNTEPPTGPAGADDT